MIIYLLHYQKPIGTPQEPAQREAHGLPPRQKPYTAHAQHYIGITDNLGKRIQHHAKGTAQTALTRTAARTGNRFIIARLWTNADRYQERYIKSRLKNARELCPLCNPHARRRARRLPQM